MSARSRKYNLAFDGLDRHAAGRTALIVIDETGRAERWSYGDLSLATSRFASALVRKNIRKGERVLIGLPNGVEFPIAFFGAIKRGAVPIPFSSMLTKAEQAFLKKDSGARLVLDHPDKVQALLAGEFETSCAVPVRPEDPAYWLYTSGTEGKPKAVIHAHRSIPAHDARSRVWMDLKKNDVVFNTGALNWSYSLTCALADTFRKGAATVVLRGKPEPERLLEIVEGQKVTILMSVPGIYRRLTEYGESHPKSRRLFRSVRVCLSAGEKLSSDIRSRFRNVAGLTIREGLGMTEHSVYLAQPKGKAPVEGSCGRAIPGHRVAVLREDLRPAKPGEIGILASHRSCQGLMLGYYRRPKEQKRVFRGGWFLSGDLAYRDAAGNFFYVGRRDDVITAGGYRISPMEVEAVINRHPAVQESAVIGWEIAAGKTVVCAYVVLKPSWKPTEALRKKIQKESREKLASYKTPREIRFVDCLPKTSNGKIQRAALRRGSDSAPA